MGTKIYMLVITFFWFLRPPTVWACSIRHSVAKAVMSILDITAMWRACLVMKGNGLRPENYKYRGFFWGRRSAREDMCAFWLAGVTCRRRGMLCKTVYDRLVANHGCGAAREHDSRDRSFPLQMGLPTMAWTATLVGEILMA